MPCPLGPRLASSVQQVNSTRAPREKPTKLTGLAPCVRSCRCNTDTASQEGQGEVQLRCGAACSVRALTMSTSARSFPALSARSSPSAQTSSIMSSAEITRDGQVQAASSVLINERFNASETCRESTAREGGRIPWSQSRHQPRTILPLTKFTRKSLTDLVTFRTTFGSHTSPHASPYGVWSTNQPVLMRLQERATVAQDRLVAIKRLSRHSPSREG